jgi:hypothetical protein
MGHNQEHNDQIPESSVEHEIKSSSSSEAGQPTACRCTRHDDETTETIPIRIRLKVQSRVHPQSPTTTATAAAECGSKVKLAAVSTKPVEGTIHRISYNVTAWDIRKSMVLSPVVDVFESASERRGADGIDARA